MKRMTDYQRQLVEEHMHLVDRVIKKHFEVRGGAYMAYEDLYQTGCEALCKAVLHYRPECGPFYALAQKCIYHALIDYCRKVTTGLRKTSTVDFEEAMKTHEYHPSFTAKIFRGDLLMFLYVYSQQYTGIAQKGIEAMMMKQCGYTSQEVATHFGTTVNNVNAWISRARSKLKKEPDYKNFQD